MGIFKGIVLLLLVSSQAWAVCPKDQTDQNEVYIHECDQEGRLLLKSRYVDDKLAEKNFYTPGVKRPYRRDVFISKYAKPASYRFKYLITDQDGDHRLKEVEVYDFLNNFIGLHAVDANPNAFESRNSKPPKVMVMDTGFNWAHKDLISKIYFNPNETLNGKDDDGDGLVDNITTLNGTLGAGGSVDYLSNINQILQIPTKDAPLSHGGYVASVAMKGIESYSFMGVGGDIYSPVFLYKALELINKNELKFVNMSFGFGDKKSPIIIGRDSFEALSGIMMAAPKTLFVVASGNGSKNFDESSYSEYPACFKSRNLITVGALDTDEIREEDFETYLPAQFSNIGERCVDLFAPGVKVEGAGLVNTRIKASGTSVSSPYVLNVLLKMHEINENLSSSELKKILMETAYVPKSNVLPSRSGGIVYPERAYEAVRLSLIKSSLEEAIKSSFNEVLRLKP